MKPTDFTINLAAFFSVYLPDVKNVSENTILSYRDTFRLLLAYCGDVKKIQPGMLCFKQLDDHLVVCFLEWLENERGCSIATINQRLAAIHAFFRYVQAKESAPLHMYQQILQIPRKKHNKRIIRYLTPEQTKDLLAAPDASRKSGRRDITLLSVLYDTGALVQELCNLRVCDIRLDNPAIITLTGGGGKTRYVPVGGNTVKLLQAYLQEYNLLQEGNPDALLFFNERHKKLTRSGIGHILQKYSSMLAIQHHNIAEKLTPNMIRHSKAMHLYQSGINLMYIRDILGHVNIYTTNNYASAAH